MIGILGGGAMGTALAIHLHRAGKPVTIFATEFDRQIVEARRSGSDHPALLGVPIPEVPVLVPEEWEAHLGELEMAVLCVSTAGLVGTIAKVGPHLKADALMVVATKGWEAETMRPAAQIVAEEVGEDRVVALVGPSLAIEVAKGTPTAMVCAGRSETASKLVAEAFSSPTMRTYTSDDVAGVEVGAILKNVIAISIGIVDGAAGDDPDSGVLNMRSFLFARGLIEMATLAQALGGRTETILGLTGAGDLFVTALGGRNGKFGRLVGAGATPSGALAQMNTTVEGVANAGTAARLAEKHGLDLPLVAAVARILDGADPSATLASLFAGEVGPEWVRT